MTATDKRRKNLKSFKPGQSGNPKGHPKGQRNLSTILREMLAESVEVTIDGKKTKVQFQDVLVRKLVKKANEGDLRAIQECFNRIEGMPKQRSEVTITGESIPVFLDPDRKELGGK